MGTSFDLSVCICTYKRPDLLAGLLQRLQELHEIEQIAEIVIVDNDPARSASAACVSPARFRARRISRPASMVASISLRI